MEQGSSSARDVYSYGIGIYCFVARKEPFSGHSNLQTFLRAITRETNPERPPLPKDETQCPKSLRALAEECWEADYKKRPVFQEIIKKFDSDILVDCAIFDEEGRKFWKKNFFGKDGLQTEVKWDKFINAFGQYNGEQYDSQSIEYKLMKSLFSPEEKNVSLESFGNIIGFFTPLKPKTWVSNACQLMFQDFFWGDTSGPKAQKALGNKPEGTFLIRFSSKDSNYTLSFVGGKKIWHTRIIHPYAQNKFALDGAPNKIYSTLQDLIKATKESGTIDEVCEGNPFKVLFGDTAENAGYATLQYDDSDEDLDI